MDPLEKYLGQLTYIHGPGVAESSSYGALETLPNAIRDTLTPAVLCVMQLKNTGAGSPDGGLFTASQFSHGADVHAETPSLLPERSAAYDWGAIMMRAERSTTSVGFPGTRRSDGGS